jgi:cellulose synthase/poly-beta-1,6-N-acetylglucosamine synthase-like glycosyltransferase
METLLSNILAIITSFLAIPVTVFFIEITAAITSKRARVALPRLEARRRVAVLLPAHNESTLLLPTVADIKQQLYPGDRFLIVADNCTDDTAAVAAAAGAEVIERHDFDRVGKGYALDFGIRFLSLDPPEIVIVIDADCRLASDTINQLATACAMTGRPVQALYLMMTHDESSINHQVAEFAWRVKNWMRPLGLYTLGLPCQLMGTGMALPWNAIRVVNLASGSIVEDLRLGLDLAQAGHPPIFCPTARVSSEFASSVKGAGIQRTRWEQGHMQTIAAVPRLAWRAIVQRNWGLLALTLDLSVPPLSLLLLLVIGMFVVVLLASFVGLSSAAMPISTAVVSTFLLASVFAWFKCGRDVLPIRTTLSIVPYVIGKVGIYVRILSRRSDARWVKTDRTKPNSDSD